MTKSETNKLDKLIRGIINERDRGICQYCGDNGNNVHHIVGRRNRSTRWYPANLLLLCPGCHTFRSDSFHQDPMGTMEWFERKFPDRYQRVMERKNQILKMTYEQVLADIEENS